LPDELKAFVEEQVEQGNFSSASEYLRSLIRDDKKDKIRQALDAKLLEGLRGETSEMTVQDWEDIRLQALESVEKKLLEGLESGPGIEVDEAYWRRKWAALRERHRNTEDT
jgi:antitoxin ParD1/3/4